MRIVFMGTSHFAIPSLKALIASEHEIAGVVSQPDKQRGRGRKVTPTPVKEIAEQYKLELLQTANIKTPESIKRIKQWKPELIIVVSYGQIIPLSILEYPRHGCINVHASLLPRYRGAAPVQRALMDGIKSSGITIMFMDEGLDTGDIIMQEAIAVDDNINHGELEKILADMGADLLLQVVDRLVQGEKLPRVVQDDSQASYAARISKEDEIINWSEPAYAIHNRIRALNPQPGAYSYINGTKVKIFASKVRSEAGSGVIAEVIEVDKNTFQVQTGEGILEVLEIQKAGKKRMPTSEFLKGFTLHPGVLLGSKEG
ncbi:methionyl-tRNA formyltransferase [Syntrophomonas wolfei]|uniref:Methionyl-tRNA formyltransferase n=1 Tax=Syntrophomonas wolfei subsp. wolfei (strain DSM 2245B / Goettingen) TaxID=335541 RepID=FMT_SYNWW|nr:methionyl-tRNA formyltransferase [Syntrophomonas wolfei]Q0AXL4.1 RecName: Full=Methionyl-tRNA formyltransferase [Syntrophomonas wolfei subsp. wolfei str. Goettingen G311]ABI68540.1 methionyl-tRNA formyltransferase [Syntrophomonas wolfei subsp. wolfei str. Goettingen G311]